MTEDDFIWDEEHYRKSATSSAFWYTPYCSLSIGWDAMSRDPELNELLRMEFALSSSDDRLKEIAAKTIRTVCPCGHYTYPMPILKALESIGSETPSDILYTCFHADKQRKTLASDYCFCLDAWLNNACPESAASELNYNNSTNKERDWNEVCNAVWSVLGEHTEKKDMLIESLISELRYWIKMSSWKHGKETEMGRDLYIGDFTVDHVTGHAEQYIFNYKPSLKKRQLSEKLKQIAPEWKQRCFWLCAPKAFRYLERTVYEIGTDRQNYASCEIPSYMQCETTYPDHEEAAMFFKDAMDGMLRWCNDGMPENTAAEQIFDLLDEKTAGKRWLTLLLHKRLKMLASNGEEFTSLVQPDHSHKRGSGKLYPMIRINRI